MPVISIIVPVYNVEKYLHRCLDSVLNQTLSDLEIICVNDGTKDGSVAILEEYAARDNRIKILHKKNGGLSSARNEGLKYATAKYIGFVDSDDWIDSNTYLLAYSAMKESGADLVCYYAQIENEDFASDHPEIERAINYHAIRRNGLYCVSDEVVSGTVVTAWNKLYKKSIIEKYGIRFPDGLIGEDVEFFYKYIVMCKSVYYIDVYLYHYVQRTNSIIWNAINLKDRKRIDRLQIGYNVYMYFLQHSLVQSYRMTMSKLLLWDCLWGDYFRTANKYRPYVLKHATKIIRNMNLNLMVDSADILHNISQRKYAQIPFLKIWKNLSCGLITTLICKSKTGKPEILIDFLGLCFKFDCSFALPFVRRLRSWRRKSIKFRLNELNARVNNLDTLFARIDNIDSKLNQVNGFLNKIDNWTMAAGRRIEEADTRVEDTIRRVGESSLRMEDTIRRVEETDRRLARYQIISNRLITDHVKEFKYEILAKSLEKVQNITEHLPYSYNQEVEAHLKVLPDFIFCPNNGNFGDVAIAAAEYQFFEYNGCKFFVYDLYADTMPEEGVFNLVYGGGGLFVKYWNYQAVIEIFKSSALKHIIILPSSFFECDDLLEIFDERFTVFCRERRSYEYCREKNKRAEFILSHDMAFNLDIVSLKKTVPVKINENLLKLSDIYLDKIYEGYSFYMVIRSKLIQVFSDNTIVTDNGIRMAYLLRTDAESKSETGKAATAIEKRIDLSTHTWSSCADPGVVKILSALFIDAINTLDVVITDRLHVGIVASMLGKRVYLIDNSYGKVSGVYEQSMKGIKNVCLLEDFGDFSPASVDIRKTSADLTLFETDKSFLDYFKEYSSVYKINDVITDSIFSY